MYTITDTNTAKNTETNTTETHSSMDIRCTSPYLNLNFLMMGETDTNTATDTNNDIKSKGRIER